MGIQFSNIKSVRIHRTFEKICSTCTICSNRNLLSNKLKKLVALLNLIVYLLCRTSSTCTRCSSKNRPLNEPKVMRNLRRQPTLPLCRQKSLNKLEKQLFDWNKFMRFVLMPKDQICSFKFTNLSYSGNPKKLTSFSLSIIFYFVLQIELVFNIQ